MGNIFDIVIVSTGVVALAVGMFGIARAEAPAPRHRL
jgi:hypothetical protein